MKTHESLLTRRLALVATGCLIAFAQSLCAQTLVEDDFNGTSGTPPNASKFEWSGEVTQNGSGALDLQTWSVNESWLKSKASALPGASGQPLMLTFRAYAYAEGWNPGVYGNKQPRGLRVGTDANNAIEFYSAAWNSIGMRVCKDGVESSATHAFPTGVATMNDYEIRVTQDEAVFLVNGQTIGTLTTNIPTAALNFHISTHDGYAGNVPVSLDRMSLATSSTPTRVIGLTGNLAFGKVRRSSSATATLTISNTGNSPLAVTGIDYPACFSGAWSGSIASGGSQAVTVTFQPTAIQDYGGTITVQSDKTDGVSTIPATGSGAEPVLRVEQPAGTVMSSGDSRGGGTLIDGETASLSFSLANTGNLPLTVSATEFLGTDAGSFSLNSPLPAQIDEGGSTSFAIRFAPSTCGAKFATFRISTDDPLVPAFDIALSGHLLSRSQDSDNDGMNDAAEYRLAALGFDWDSAQPDLVTAYFAEAPLNGLLTKDQVQAMRPSAPLLSKNPATGKFVLAIRLMKSTDLRSLEAIPFLESGIRTPEAGVLEFELASPEQSAFFQLELK